MINSVRNTVLSVLNKNNYGYISPSDFNLFAKQAQMELFVGVFDEYNKTVNKENARVSGSGYADMRTPLEECIDTFSSTAALTNIATNTFNAPLNYYMISNVLVNGRLADRVSHGTAFNMLASNFITPSANYPIYTMEGDVLTFYPATISSSDVIVSQYIRLPRAPKWTYIQLLNGEPIFDQSASDYQDFELPDDMEYALAQKILQYAGISIREVQVYQYAKAEEQQQQQ